jgi:hypothetical protein
VCLLNFGVSFVVRLTVVIRRWTFEISQASKVAYEPDCPKGLDLDGVVTDNQDKCRVDGDCNVPSNTVNTSRSSEERYVLHTLVWFFYNHRRNSLSLLSGCIEGSAP